MCLSMVKNFDDVAIVREPKLSRQLGRSKRSKLRTLLAAKHKRVTLRNDVLNWVFGQSLRKLDRLNTEVEDGYFGEASAELRASYAHLIHATVEPGRDINDPRYVELIQRLEPDIIVVTGTSLVKKPIIATPRSGILNCHTGLSPHYRGTNTNLWPILNREPQYCGVTVHLINPGIDTGEIIYHGLPNIEVEDTYFSINAKTIVLGAELMKRAIEDTVAGNLKPKKQWTRGRLYNRRDFNGLHASRYFRLADAGYIRDFSAAWRDGSIEPPEGLQLLLDDGLPQHIPPHYR